MPSTFFSVLGTVRRSISFQRINEGSMPTREKILFVAVTLLWVVVAIGTVKHALTGELLFAPCLKEVEQAELRAEQRKRRRYPVS